MSLSASAIQMMADFGLSAQQIAAVAAANEAPPQALSRAEIQANYRARKRSQSVTNEVTSEVTHGNTPPPSPSPLLSPHTPQITPHPHPPENQIPRAREEAGLFTKPEKPKKPQKIATFMPECWQPNDFKPGSQSRRVVDGWPPGELANQLERFTAHHAKSGQKWVNWQAAWSTWVLNSERFGNGKNGRNQANRNGFAGNRPDEQIGRTTQAMLSAMRRLESAASG